MVIGVPKEIKNNENRVAITPAGVHALTKEGHKVMIESSAGEGSSITDGEYIKAVADIVRTAGEVFEKADLIVKVKEPLEPEFALFREGQILFTYLHLAANPGVASMLLDKKITGIAYETVRLPNGSLPLLAPMSEVAGRLAAQVGANALLKYNGGSGILLGGIPGVPPAEVLIIGGGVVGTSAARMAAGLGARVTVMDLDHARLSYLDDIFGGRIATLMYNEYAAAEALRTADLLIVAVLVAGAKAPKVVTAEMVKTMKKGSAIVDVAIDQGGCIKTIDRVTSHDDPYYEKYGVIHYSVANMPGSVPRTSTYGLTGATLPYLLKLARKGIAGALAEDKALMEGLNTYKGTITYKAVADSLGLKYCPVADLLNNS